MTRLTLHVYTSPDKDSLIADWSQDSIGVSFETGEHGYDNLTAFIPMSIEEAFRYYEATPAAHIVLSDGAFVAFEGRVEDRRVSDQGLEIDAFGYWREMTDFPYTALWSTQIYSDFRQVTDDDSTNFAPSRWSMDSNGRLFFGTQITNWYGPSVNKGGQLFLTPHNASGSYDLGGRKIAKVTFDYDVDLPTDFKIIMSAFNEPIFTSVVDEWSVTTSGSGSADIDLSTAKDGILFQCLNAHASTWYQETNSDGVKYAKITNLRIWTTTSDEVLADEIVKDIVGFVSGFSEVGYTRISALTHLIESPGVDINEALYEDVLCATVLNDLANLGDDSTPPERYEVGIWEDRLLHFRQRGSAGREWFTDVVSLQLESSIDKLANSVYVVYQDVNGRKLRTNPNWNQQTKADYGLTRRVALASTTTDATEAAVRRDSHLEDFSTIRARANLVTQGLFNSSGAAVPLYMARSGDTLTLRNLPIGLGETADRIRSFRLSKTRFDVDNNVLIPTPEEPLPSLINMVAEGASS